MSAQPLLRVPPKEREALLAALTSPTHKLRRMRGGFVAVAGDGRTSGTTTAYTVSKRMALRLEREGFVEFDHPEYPDVITLNDQGVALATQLRDATAAKAGAR